MKTNILHLVSLWALFLMPFSGNTQRVWERLFFEEQDAPSVWQQAVESYDKGFLLGGNFKQNHGIGDKGWFVKTDINGYELWGKIIDNQTNTLNIHNYQQNEVGEIFFVGAMKFPGLDVTNPFVVKLNPCGELEWCRVLHNNSPLVLSANARAVAVLPDGGCAVVIRHLFGTFKDRITLVRFDSMGDMQWLKSMQSDNDKIKNETANHLLYIPDIGFLITGDCGYLNDNQPLPKETPKPYYIRTDLDGNKLWELVSFTETVQTGGFGNSSMIWSDGIYYSAVWRYYFWTNQGHTPSLIKFNDNGEFLSAHDFVSGYEVGRMFNLGKVNDTLLSTGACWGDIGSTNNYAVLFDTLGNLVDTRIVDAGGYLPSYVKITHDNQLLFYTSIKTEDLYFNAILLKFDEDLQYSKIINTPFVYDSLCPYPIVSDTIMLDMCELITIMVGNRPVEKEETQLLVYPNPARESITIQVPERFYLHGDQDTYGQKPLLSGEALLQAYDMHGRLHYSLYQDIENNRLEINTSHWPEGLYVLRLVTEGAVPLRSKVMVVR